MKNIDEAIQELLEHSGVPWGNAADMASRFGWSVEKARRRLEGLAMVARGMRWRDVMERTGLTCNDLMGVGASKELLALVRTAKDSSERMRRARAEDALDDLVENGERIPVVAGGVVIDERRVRPVRAIELALNHGHGAEATGGGLTLNIVLPSAVAAEPEPVVVEERSVAEIADEARRTDFAEEDEL